VTEILAIGRTSGLVGMHRTNRSKETISVAVEVVHTFSNF